MMMIYCDKINDHILSEQTKQKTQTEIGEKKTKVILDKVGENTTKGGSVEEREEEINRKCKACADPTVINHYTSKINASFQNS